jgi:hypothetical protein
VWWRFASAPPPNFPVNAIVTIQAGLTLSSVACCPEGLSGTLICGADKNCPLQTRPYWPQPDNGEEWYYLFDENGNYLEYGDQCDAFNIGGSITTYFPLCLSLSSTPMYDGKFPVWSIDTNSSDGLSGLKAVVDSPVSTLGCYVQWHIFVQQLQLLRRFDSGQGQPGRVALSAATTSRPTSTRAPTSKRASSSRSAFSVASAVAVP